MTERADRTAVFAGITLLAITVAWWALAFWPVDTTSAVWLARAKSVCFGLTASGLPDAAGWVALISQPLVMGGMYFAIWGDRIPEVARIAGRTTLGKAGLVAALAILPLGAAGITWRIGSAPSSDFSADPGVLPATYPRLNRPAPALGLTDQNGNTLRVADLEGTPALVTFAFGNCVAICPVVVHDAVESQRRLSEAGNQMAVVVITLDPWRDVPSRLPHLFDQWKLHDSSYALSGSVANVESVLDSWDVPRVRDEATGDITHPRLSYILDGSGVIAYAVSSGPDAIVDLVGRLDGHAELTSDHHDD